MYEYNGMTMFFFLCAAQPLQHQRAEGTVSKEIELNAFGKKFDQTNNFFFFFFFRE